LQKAFPNNKVSTVIRKEKCEDISCFSNRFETLLGWKAKCGSKFIQRARVPKWVLSRKVYIIPCVRGLLETDGSVYLDRGYKAVFFTSIIPELADDFYEMSLRLGFDFNRYDFLPKTKYNSKRRYNLRLSKNVDKFLEIVKPEKMNIKNA